MPPVKNAQYFADLQELLNMAGPERVDLYAKQVIPRAFLDACSGTYNSENALEWVDFWSFRKWLEQRKKIWHWRSRVINPEYFDENNTTYQKFSSESAGGSSVTLSDETECETKPGIEHEVIVIHDSDSEPDLETTLSRALPMAVPPTIDRPQAPRNIIRITRLTSVRALKVITAIPTCWTVPRPDENFAYLLDLTSDTRNWNSADGRPTTVAAIINSIAQDAWGGGKSTKASRKAEVFAFGKNPVSCIVVDYVCHGVYHCDRVNEEYIRDMERYEFDEAKQSELITAEQEIRKREESSTELIEALRFWRFLSSLPCTKMYENHTRCPGDAAIRPLETTVPGGKKYFVGCSGSAHEHDYTHRCMSIPPEVNEDLLHSLLQNKGLLAEGQANNFIRGKKCTYIVAPYGRGRGRKYCPHTHIENGRLVEGLMAKRECKAKLRIYCPADPTDHRAIILPHGAHNHPLPSFAQGD